MALRGKPAQQLTPGWLSRLVSARAARPAAVTVRSWSIFVAADRVGAAQPRQGQRDDFADRRVIVAGDEADQFDPVGRQGRKRRAG